MAKRSDGTDDGVPTTGELSDADVTALEGGMTDVTPRGLEPDQTVSSRLNPLKDTLQAGRGEDTLVRLVYEGRKMNSGRVSTRTPAGEHIDVTVPTEGRNEDAVEDYKSALPPDGSLPPDQLIASGQAAITPESVHLDGHPYHHQQGEVTPVYPVDVDFHLNHPAYKFSRAPETTKA